MACLDLPNAPKPAVQALAIGSQLFIRHLIPAGAEHLQRYEGLPDHPNGLHF